MARSEHHSPTDVSIGKIDTVDEAMSSLLTALRDVDSDHGLIIELVAAWRDLSFDDRRYLGTAFPRLTTCLIMVEDVLG